MADVTSDRHIYGDTIPFFDAEAADAEAAANTEVVAQDHRFRLVAGPKTCAAAAGVFR